LNDREGRSKIFLLTGPPRIGKTTAFLKTIDLMKNLGYDVGGMVTSELVRGNDRIGFSIRDINTGRIGELASVANLDGPRLGKYGVNLVDLLAIGVGAIDRAIEYCDLIGIDEIGPMELLSPEFRSIVRKAIRVEKPILATIHFRARNSLIEEVRSRPDSKTIEITIKNRHELPLIICKEISALLGHAAP